MTYSVLFPCRPYPLGSQPLGSPVPAEPCRCAVPLLEDGGCVRCGHLPVDTIASTWADRARVLALPQRRRRLAVAA